MKIVNITLPAEMEKHMEEVEGFITPAEFIRYATVNLLLHISKLSIAEKVGLIRKLTRSRMKARGEVFDEEKELAELRKIRENLWEEKHGKGSS